MQFFENAETGYILSILYEKRLQNELSLMRDFDP